jgi:hypothetical protein
MKNHLKLSKMMSEEIVTSECVMKFYISNYGFGSEIHFCQARKRRCSDRETTEEVISAGCRS